MQTKDCLLLLGLLEEKAKISAEISAEVPPLTP
jgi:hypothetical protein